MAQDKQNQNTQWHNKFRKISQQLPYSIYWDSITLCFITLANVADDTQLAQKIGEQNATKLVDQITSLEAQLTEPDIMKDTSKLHSVLEESFNKLEVWLKKTIEQQQSQEKAAQTITLSKIATLISSGLKIIKHSFSKDKSAEQEVSKHKNIITEIMNELSPKSTLSMGLQNVKTDIKTGTGKFIQKIKAERNRHTSTNAGMIK